MTYESIRDAVDKLKSECGCPLTSWWFSPAEADAIKKHPDYDPETNTICGLKVLYTEKLPEGTCYICDGSVSPG